MKDIRIELVPKNTVYPTKVATQSNLTIPKVYNDTYLMRVTSSWYQEFSEVVTVNSAMNIPITVKFKEGKITLTINETGLIEPKNEFKAVIGSEEKVFSQSILTYTRKFSDTSYQLTVTHEKNFYEPFTFTIPVNPTNANPNILVKMVRKPSDWVEETNTRPIPFEKKTVEDINVRPSDSKITQEGVEGVMTVKGSFEYIDGVLTGRKTNTTETVTKEPVTEIYTKGTAVVEWKTEVISSTITIAEPTYVNDDTLEVGIEKVQSPMQTGQTDTVQEVEYMNGTKTGNTRNVHDVVVKEPVPAVIIKGTKLEGIVDMSRKLKNSEGTEYYPFTVTPNPNKNYSVEIFVGNTRATEWSIIYERVTFSALYELSTKGATIVRGSRLNNISAMSDWGKVVGIGTTKHSRVATKIIIKEV